MIPDDERGLLQLNSVDDVGTVFSWRGRVFRAVRTERAGETRRLLGSGLLDELSRLGAIPETRISDHTVPEAEFLLESRRIAPLVHPHEWSFSMLRAAALAVNAVGDRARDFGFNLKDCHPDNVVFDGLRPCYVDIGSFLPDQFCGWRPYAQFLERYYYPLMLWRKSPNTARLSLLNRTGISHVEYLRLRYAWLDRLGLPLQEALVDLAVRPALKAETRRLAGTETSSARIRRMAHRFVAWLMPLGQLDRSTVLRTIDHLAAPPTPPLPAPDLDTRVLQQVFDRLTGAGTSSLTLHVVGCISAGSMGSLIDHDAVLSVLCSDEDDAAIDRLYQQLIDQRWAQDAVTLAVCDPLESLERSSALPTDVRLQCDVVLVTAPALQHYLQRSYQIDSLLRRFLQFARRALVLDCGPAHQVCATLKERLAGDVELVIAPVSAPTAHFLVIQPAHAYLTTV